MCIVSIDRAKFRDIQNTDSRILTSTLIPVDSRLGRVEAAGEPSSPLVTVDTLDFREGMFVGGGDEGRWCEMRQCVRPAAMNSISCCSVS